MQISRLFSSTALRGTTRSVLQARFYSTAAPATPAKVPIALIQDLRNRTGAGITDCKKALEQNNHDIASAASWLRSQGKLTATKLSSRVAAEGVVALAVKDGNGVIVELNSETDFVSRGVSFRSLAHKVVDASVTASQYIPQNAIENIDVNNLKKLQVEVENDEPGKPNVQISVEEAVTRAITKTKENINIRRAFGVAIKNGVVGGYVHGGEGDAKAGRLASLVVLTQEGTINHEALSNLASQLAKHVVGLKPKCVDRDSPIFKQALEEARAVPGAKNVSKDSVAEDIVLLDQKVFNGDGETVRQVLKQAGTASAPVRVHSFLRLAVGEGIEKKQDDFANEVMGMVKQ